MCRKLALAATLIGLIGSSAFAAKAPAPAPATAASPGAPAPAVQPAPRPPSPEERAQADRMDPLARAAFWSHVTDIDPSDTFAAVKLAKALRELSRYDEAQAAVERVLVVDPANFDALIESARVFIASGQGFFAIDPAQRAMAAAPKDWRPVSLLAIALEQAQRDDEALAAHQKALALAPNNPATLSNLAMYDAAHGQTAQAEVLLRRAVAAPGVTVQVRQNLALILGLEGKSVESEALERQDLPPALVANNLAYLRPAGAASAERSWAAVQGVH
jgi:Flp pilus assembly protein TadD